MKLLTKGQKESYENENYEKFVTFVKKKKNKIKNLNINT